MNSNQTLLANPILIHRHKAEAEGVRQQAVNEDEKETLKTSTIGERKRTKSTQFKLVTTCSIKVGASRTFCE